MPAQQDYHDPQRFGVWRVLTICAAVTATVAPATWYFARDRVADELRQCTDSRNWHLPENLADLGKLSKKLHVDLNTREELERLKTQEQELVKRIESLNQEHKRQVDKLQTSHNAAESDYQNKLESLRQETKRQVDYLQQSVNTTESNNRELRQQLTALQGETIEIPVGEARPVGHKSVFIGITSTNPYSHSASIQFGKDEHRINVGTPLSTTIDDQTYTITLVKVTEKNCVFSYRTDTIRKEGT